MTLRAEKVITLLGLENAILDLFEKNRVIVDGAITALWQLLTAILIEEQHRREIIISNIEQQKELLLENVLGEKMRYDGGPL